jgi:adenylate kinase
VASKASGLVEKLVAQALRDDDREDTVRNRLKVYHDQTEPLIGFYSTRAQQDPKIKYSRVEGVGSVDEIRTRVMGALR